MIIELIIIIFLLEKSYDLKDDWKLFLKDGN